MSENIQCVIASRQSMYEIVISQGILERGAELSSLIQAGSSKFAIITDEIVEKYYAHKLLLLLQSQGLQGQIFPMPTGEINKTRKIKESLEDQLLASGYGKDCVIIALGGGVVTDIAGFLAATFCRGVQLIMIPTTLLAMVDASIGGKNGVNCDYGKNLIGTIYQPHVVIIDTDVLKTLSVREMRNGVVEMVKHGLIADRNHFDDLARNHLQLLVKDPKVIEKAIFDSCHIKNRIVQQDEKEKGLRHLLNFGHTIAHAIEKVSDYTISHGEAVAVGILVECHLAVQLQHLKREVLEEIKAVFKCYQLPLKIPSHVPVDAYLQAMTYDKKTREGKPRFIFLKAIGYPMVEENTYCWATDELILIQALKWMKDDLCCH